MVLSFFIAVVELCSQEFAADGGAAGGGNPAGS
jgi:hypothetical protein